MPRESPYTVVLTVDEKYELQAIARKYTSQYRDVIRAKIVLLAANGLSNKEIGFRLDLPRQTVSKWRKRFFEERLSGLQEKPRQAQRFFPLRLLLPSNPLRVSCLANLAFPFPGLHTAKSLNKLKSMELSLPSAEKRFGVG